MVIKCLLIIGIQYYKDSYWCSSVKNGYLKRAIFLKYPSFLLSKYNLYFINDLWNSTNFKKKQFGVEKIFSVI